MERYYFKCTYCERPFAVETDPVTVREIIKAPCPLCQTLKDEDGKLVLRYMGRVEKSNLVKDVVKAACDARCTNALGPVCDCVCLNHNHGTKRLVSYSKIVGKLEVINKDMLNDNESYLLRIKKLAASKRKLKDLIKATLELKYEKILTFLKTNPAYRLASEEYELYLTYHSVLNRIDKIETMRLVKRKVTELAKLYAGVL